MTILFSCFFILTNIMWNKWFSGSLALFKKNKLQLRVMKTLWLVFRQPINTATVCEFLLLDCAVKERPKLSLRELHWLWPSKTKHSQHAVNPLQEQTFQVLKHPHVVCPEHLVCQLKLIIKLISKIVKIIEYWKFLVYFTKLVSLTIDYQNFPSTFG